jgi:hypothetical protein
MRPAVLDGAPVNLPILFAQTTEEPAQISMRSRPGTPFSRMALRDSPIGRLAFPDFNPDGSRHYLFPAGTFCFNSAVQFSTTLISPGTCSAALSIKKRWPSEETS